MLTASENAWGWHVTDDAGGIWWPDSATEARILLAEDQAAEAVRICEEEPMRGTWRA